MRANLITYAERGLLPNEVIISALVIVAEAASYEAVSSPSGGLFIDPLTGDLFIDPLTGDFFVDPT